MRAKELRQKTEKELDDLLIEKSHNLGKLKFDLASKKLKNVMQIKELRREIARIKTIIKDFNTKK